MSKVYYFLLQQPKYTIGAYCAQVGHATSMLFCNHSTQMQDYAKDSKNMTKVVLKLDSALDVAELKKMLENENIEFVEWIEQPENIITCIATVPLKKDFIVEKNLFRNYKLFK